MRRAVALALAATGLMATGCGVETPDLFVLTRTGTIPGARLTLLVNDGGTVACNGGATRSLPGPQLLAARAIERDLAPDARLGRRLPPGPGAVLSYTVRTQDGTVAFSDTSRGATPAMQRAALFGRSAAKGPCGLPR